MESCYILKIEVINFGLGYKFDCQKSICFFCPSKYIILVILVVLSRCGKWSGQIWIKMGSVLFMANFLNISVNS